MKKVFGVVALLVMVLSFSSAYAFDWGGYVGPATFKFSGFTNGTIYSFDSLGNPIPGIDGAEDAWGVGRVQQIFDGVDASGTAVWNNGQGGEEITYFYYGITDWSVTPDISGNAQIKSTGGIFEFYLNSSGTADFNAANRSGSSFTTITDSGTKFARLVLAPGVIVGDGVTTIEETLSGNIVAGNVSGSGSALGSFDLTGAWNTPWAQALNSDAFANGTDMNLGFTISQNVGTSNGFSLTHDDPAHVVVTPEPISSALFLLGGCALMVRRLRKQRK